MSINKNDELLQRLKNNFCLSPKLYSSEILALEKTTNSF